MWTDKLLTKWLGDGRVKVIRTIESPATPDELRITFSDGSQLWVRVEVDHPPEARDECEAAEITQKTTAARFYGDIVRTLYNQATDKFMDTDFPPARVLRVGEAPDDTVGVKEHLNKPEPF